MRTAARIAAVIGAVLAVLALRIVSGSHGELQRGDRLRAHNDLAGATIAYRRAARWYVPGNPYSTEALARLASVAVECEDTECELAAWRSVRGAILSTRSLYTPHVDRLRAAEARIAELSTEDVPLAERQASERRFRERLANVEAPNLGYAVLGLIGWVVWTTGSFLFGQLALDEEDRFVPRQAQLWGTVIVLGFGFFVLGLALA